MEQENKNKFPRGVEIVGSAIIENDKGEILLVKSPKWGNKWTMPGGHIEPGEKIEEALIREAEEEVGIDLKPVRIIAFGELIGSKDFHRPAHFIYFDLLCKAETNNNVKLDGVELNNYIWVSPEDGLKMDLGESYKETIKDYIKFKKSSTEYK